MATHGVIRSIEFYLPNDVLTTQSLSDMFPRWGCEEIERKTGIRSRHIAGDDECSSDLAITAALRLFSSGACQPSDIDFLLLCTQSPDYILPTTACLVQQRLQIPTTAGALDIGLGCSGFVYGLGLAEGLIASGQATSILLITADTYSKYLHPADKSTRTLFGDGAAVTWIGAQERNDYALGPFLYGTDGRGAMNLVVTNSGTRREKMTQDYLDTKSGHLHMNGNAIFQFAIQTIPDLVDSLLKKAQITIEEIDLFVFHQANAFMLEELRLQLKIPRDKMQISLLDCANTVSSTIPIALKYADLEGKLFNGCLLMLVGFGVGYSWAATLVRWIE